MKIWRCLYCPHTVVAASRQGCNECKDAHLEYHKQLEIANEKSA